MGTHLKLNNGILMPIVGLGTWQSKSADVQNAVRAALDAGYRHIDTAALYNNEADIHLPPTHMRPDLVQRGFDLSLVKLQLNYIDLFLVHLPIAFKYVDDETSHPRDENGEIVLDNDIDLTHVWKAMEKLVSNGRARSIGVSNFNSQQIEQICNIATIKPVTNQVECNPYLAQTELQQFCEERGVVLTAYAPLGSVQRMESVTQKEKDDPVLLQDQTVAEISSKHQKSVAQVVLRYLIQRGIMAIPKSITPSRIMENFQVFDFELSKEDMDKLNTLSSKNARFFWIPFGKNHKDYPFNIPY